MAERSSLPEELIDAVYRVVLEPGAWDDVMHLVGRRFPSAAQSFYFLHREPRRLQPVAFNGIDPEWLRSFDDLYFAPDNPWIRLTERLHRPGVVRTNERLDRVLRERGALYKSAYYNEWMKPQGFKTSIGNTLVVRGDLVANITLFRPPDMKTFSSPEVSAFESLTGHMTRAIQMATRLEQAEHVPSVTAAFEAMAHPVAVIDARRRVLYANSRMESLFSRRTGLASRVGELVAADVDCQAALVAHVAATASHSDASNPPRIPLVLRGPGRTRLTLELIPLVGAMGSASTSTSRYLLTVLERSAAPPAISPDHLRIRYGCTRTEAKLAQLLVEGRGLKASALAMGIRYGTARSYLKAVFEKIGVHTQAELVAVVLRQSGEMD